MFSTFSSRPVILKKKEIKKEVVKEDVKVDIKHEMAAPNNSSLAHSKSAPADLKKYQKVDTKPDVVKVEEKEKRPSKPTSGREVLEVYRTGEPVSIITYRKICNALDVLERWEASAQITFLEQFLDCSDLMDNKCTTLVTNLASLPWHKLPHEFMGKYQALLCDIAVRQVCHTKLIYEAAANNLLPRLNTDDEGSPQTTRLFTDKEEDRLFTVAHQIISHILKCFPMSSKTLLVTMTRTFPHYTKPSEVFIGYVRHVIQMTEYATKIAPDLWNLVLDNMISCDTLLSKTGLEDSAHDELAGIFNMADIKHDEGDEKSLSFGLEEKSLKLDGTMRDVISYLALKHGQALPNDIDMSWVRLGNSTCEEVFSNFLAMLESRMLMSVHVKFTSFIWLYLASINESYTTRLLDFLWSIVTRPARAQSDAKKAHGAAAYLAAFIARAKYVTITDAFSWISRIFKWCHQYIDHFSGSQVVSGVSRHGTFYSLCQAFFIAFSFRYKELVKTGDIDEVRRWGVSRVVHSQLEPLKYVSRPVGLCFAAITRSLQLVYCNHVLSLDPSAMKPFESMFPLDSYNLKISESFVAPLLRRFSPLAEDAAVVSSVLELETKKEMGAGDADDGMDFLDNEEEEGMLIGSLRDRSNTLSQCGAQSSMFTVYSSSPGLRQYDSPMNMR